MKANIQKDIAQESIRQAMSKVNNVNDIPQAIEQARNIRDFMSEEVDLDN